MDKRLCTLYENIDERIAELKNLRELFSEVWSSQAAELLLEKTGKIHMKLSEASDNIKKAERQE
ncbi:MAG: hypothetical protein E7505_06085 [Ruminococcus sp.]|nr:hypothetical protein [Ruminococcus sp.]